jgi:purine-binding chemotaxis protein CheW
VESSEYPGGRYLTFRVARQEFALDAGRVRGIVPATALTPGETPTPADPAWLAGFVKMRGGVLPVIDLRGKLGLPEGAPGREPCIVVVEAATPAGPRLAGFLADRVSEVVTARARDFRGGKLRIGRPRKVLDADVVLADV